MHTFTSLIVSAVTFIMGGVMVYLIVADRDRWDQFWEDQNRDRPLTPASWAGSPLSKAITYILALMFFVTGLLGLCRYFYIF